VLVINAAECEPYITADFRSVRTSGRDHRRHHPGHEASRHPQALIGVESNKPLAIDVLNYELMKLKLSANLEPNISIVRLKTVYPQGAEKMLIYSLTGRKVPAGGLPHDVHVLVLTSARSDSSPST
jgi:electron transport complex protein RnfC